MQVDVAGEAKGQRVNANAPRGGVVGKPDREAGGEASQHDFDRVRTGIVAEQHRRRVGLDVEWLAAARILRARSMKALDPGTAMSAVLPLGLRTELKVRQLGVRFDGVDGGKQRADIDAVRQGVLEICHGFVPFLVQAELVSSRHATAAATGRPAAHHCG